MCNYSQRLILGIISVCPMLSLSFRISCVLFVCYGWLMIDFNTVDALVEISQKYREIFY